MNKRQIAMMDYVLNEFKHRRLKSSSGKIVMKLAQAVAIAINEARNLK